MNITSIPMASSFFVCQCWSLSSGSNLPGRWVTNCRNNGTSLESLDMAAPQLWKPSFRVGSNFCFQCWMLLCFPVEFGMQIHHILQSIVKSSVCGVGKKNICSLTAQWHLANAATMEMDIIIGLKNAAHTIRFLGEFGTCFSLQCSLFVCVSPPS